MSEQPTDNFASMDCESRYDFFLSVVGEERDIWILINQDNQFLKIFSEDEGIEYLPIWPTAELASDYNSEGDLTPKAIALPEFLNKWVKGLTADGFDVGVFPGEDKSVWMTSPEELKADLQEELSAGW